MSFGLTKKQMERIRSVFERYPEVKKVVLFGSRAMGNFKKGSDVDLAVMDSIKPETIMEIAAVLNEETELPHLFDLVGYQTIADQELKQHIDQHGVVFYQRKPAAPFRQK